MTGSRVVVLDHGSGNVHSAVRALEKVGAQVELTADRTRALDADGLFLPGVGNFHACVRGMRAAEAPRIVGVRLSGGRPVLGVCVGMQALFESSTEPNATLEEGLAEWPGTVERLQAPIVPHMGWTEVEVPAGSSLFDGVESQRFYFVHSYAVRTWSLPEPTGAFTAVAPTVTHATHGERFVAAVENGPLSATQFHPEKSGEAGLHLLENWVRSL